jgi:hypothetical protein
LEQAGVSSRAPAPVPHNAARARRRGRPKKKPPSFAPCGIPLLLSRASLFHHHKEREREIS